MNLCRYSFLFFVLILFCPSILIGRNLDNKNMVPDQTIIEKSKITAMSLGLNPIPVYIEEEKGEIVFTGGASLTIRDGQYTYIENDMVINVGKLSVPFADFHLLTGEYAVVKSGRFIKQTNKIITKKSFKKSNYYNNIEAIRSNEQKTYAGQKIALDFYNTDIKNIFRILQEASGKDFAVANDVEGTVTISIKNPTPWDQILDIILEMNDLQMTMNNNIIVIKKNSDFKKISKSTDSKHKKTDPIVSINHLISEYGSKKVLYCVIGDYYSDNFNIKINKKLKKSPHDLIGIGSDFIDAESIWHDMKRYSIDIEKLEEKLKEETRKAYNLSKYRQNDIKLGSTISNTTKQMIGDFSLNDHQKKNLQEKNLPSYSSELYGNNPVRIKNPNDFLVGAGLRSGRKGKNLSIQPHGEKMVYVPNGPYEIYFIYSNKPDALFQGDSFNLNNNGIEIQIVQVAYGNYNIRQVK